MALWDEMDRNQGSELTLCKSHIRDLSLLGLNLYVYSWEGGMNQSKSLTLVNPLPTSQSDIKVLQGKLSWYWAEQEEKKKTNYKIVAPA